MRLNNPKGWSTHLTLLLKAVFSSTGPVAEVGGGVFSTPVLHWVCKSLGRKLVTYENTQEYYKFEKKFQSGMHRVKFLTNWDDMDFKTHWGVVFIDHHPSQRRGIDALNFKKTADYVVMHDTCPSDKYGWRKDLAKFKYMYDWKENENWASVASNFYDVTKWDNNILHF